MDNIKETVAKNISELRLLNNMTQMELAERLNYSDKAVSKWERAESLPDVSTLVEIAKLFDVSLDYLVRGIANEGAILQPKTKEVKYNRKAISYTVENAALLIAVVAFVITTLILGETTFQWLYFFYAFPIALVLKLIFNSIWFNPRHNYIIISALMWSILAAIHITFLYFKINISMIYLLGIPGQLTIILCSFITKSRKR